MSLGRWLPTNNVRGPKFGRILSTASSMAGAPGKRIAMDAADEHAALSFVRGRGLLEFGIRQVLAHDVVKAPLAVSPIEIR
jgi:hypothetical protein